jgi:Fe-S cluster assembly scaffold protein SufB
MAIFTTQQSTGQYIVIKSRNNEELSLNILSPETIIHIGEQAQLGIIIPEAEYNHSIHIIATKGSKIEIIERESWSGNIHWNIELIEPYAKINYISRVKSNRESNNTITITHQAPYTKSKVDCRYIIENSHPLKQHTIITIPATISHCEAIQSAEIILLTERSKFEIIPELRVATDNSNASHGVSIHPIRETDIFYLMTRGLTREQAQNSIIEGFLED